MKTKIINKVDELSKREACKIYNELISDKPLSVTTEHGDVFNFNPVKGFPNVARAHERVKHVISLMWEADEEARDHVAKVFGLKIEKPKTEEKRMEKTKKGSGVVAKCREIFDEKKTRAENIDACISAGINKSTASTQWQNFRKEKNIPAQRTRSNGAVAQCREIFDANTDKPRKEVIQLMVDAGINKSTASTQYQRLKNACK